MHFPRLSDVLDFLQTLAPKPPFPVPLLGAPSTPRTSARLKHQSSLTTQTRICSVAAAASFVVFAASLTLLWTDSAVGPAGIAVSPALPPQAMLFTRRRHMALGPARGTQYSGLSRADLVAREDDIHGEAAVAADAPQHVLTACVMVKDAADALPEFVARNHLAGVDHFVLMDDSDAAGFERLHAVVEPVRHLVSLVRVAREKITRKGWAPASQISASLDCAGSLIAGNLTKWIAMIDVDEFFEANDPIVDYGLNVKPGTPFMRVFLETQEDEPAVCIRWKSVLTNGKVDPAPCGETLARYYPSICNITSSLDGHPLARRKTVAQAEFLSLSTPLDDSYGHIGFRFLAPHNDFSCPMVSAPVEVSLIHYWSMSLIDYVRKIGRGRPRRSFEQRTVFDLLLRENLCDAKMQDPSSVYRDSAVREFIKDAGYRCDLQPDDGPPIDQHTVFRESPAVQFIVDRYAEGEHFDSEAYTKEFQLQYKSVYGGFLAGIDMIPWVHFYLHGYDPQTAANWFHK
jgi:hypothetical protein